MNDDPFAPPRADAAFDDIVRNRARKTLIWAAVVALSLSLLQFCCNPCFLVSFAAAAASLNAIRQPRWLAIGLEDDYPSEAGKLSTAAGSIGLLLFGCRLLLEVVVTGLLLSGNL